MAAAAVIAGLTGALAWAGQGRTLEVTVTYQGGEVSSAHAIYLTVWDTPNMQGGALPIGAQIVSENGGTATFPNLTASPVYVAALYDERGGWDGLSAVPSGSPAGTYSTDGVGLPAAIDLPEGGVTTVELTFTSAFRMP